MANSPSEEIVAQFTEITNVDHSRAVAILRSRGNNLENAVNAFFGGQDTFEPSVNENIPQYDEGAFASDRQGNLSQSSNFPAFQIDAGVVDSAPKYQNAAPSRPPSRSEHQRSDSLLTVAPSEDDQQQFSRQTSGTVNASQHAFGPANRSYYDPAKWAVTHPKSGVQEITPEISPGDRRRAAEEPVTMKPLTSDGDLPSLIAILGSIPGAFNLICSTMPLSNDYPYDASWWQGSSATVSSSSQAPNNDDNFKSAEELLAETQKLMAFIESTSRAYGSVEVLSSLKLLQQINTTESSTKKLADRFLLAWDTAATAIAPSHGPSKLFRSVACQAIGNEATHTPFWCFECILENVSQPWTLYDAVDSAIWSPEQSTNPSCSAFIQQAADIFVIRLIQPNASASGLMISVPESWYIDRYLPENAEAAKKMLLNMARCRAELSQILGIQSSLLQFNSLREGKTFDALNLLRTTISYLEEPSSSGQSAQTDDVGEGVNLGHEESVDCAKVAEQLKNVFTRVSSKLEALEREKEALQKAYVGFSDLLKSPTGDNVYVPKHKYHLCGVSTKPGVTYVTHSDSSNTAREGTANTKSRQWWRMEYTSEPRIIKETVSEGEVLEAAQSESRRAMLVYAKPSVLFAEKHGLPQQLIDFVNKDNDAFALEIEKWNDSKVNKSRDWDAEWSHVPESWPSAEGENDVYNNQHLTQAKQSDKDGAQNAGQRSMPDMGESELRKKSSSSHEASDDTMDASLQSETRHLEFA